MSKRKRESASVASTQNLDECARLYVKNIFSNYMAKPKVSIKKVVYTPAEDITVIDPTFNQLISLKSGKEMTKIIKKSWDHVDTASSLFESIFETVKVVEENNQAKFKLNSNVVKPGAIVRVWSSLDRVDGAESHSVVTIDYNNRRVSFDTNNPPGVKAILGDVQLPGVAHCIASPEPGFVKKLARIFFANKDYFAGKGPKASLEGTVKLKGIGILTRENIAILNKYLIVNSINMKHNYVSEIYTKQGNDFFAIQPIYRISTNLYYNKRSNIVFNTTKELQFSIQEDDKKTSLKGSKMMPINCSAFMALLFPDVIQRTSTITLSMLGTVKYIPTTPSMLRPTYNYSCLDAIDNPIARVNWRQDKLAKVELPGGVEYNILKTTGAVGYGIKKYGTIGKYLAQLGVGLATFILMVLPFGLITAILGGAYLIIPLEFYDYFAGINPTDIISNIKELFSSVLCRGFGFVPKCDINTKSIPQL